MSIASIGSFETIQGTKTFDKLPQVLSSMHMLVQTFEAYVRTSMHNINCGLIMLILLFSPFFPAYIIQFSLSILVYQFVLIFLLLFVHDTSPFLAHSLHMSSPIVSTNVPGHCCAISAP
jgi:hypothetical protein